MAADGRWARVTASVVLVAAGTAGCGLAAVDQANAQQSPVQHIVVLYLENHTFDNLLGYWCRDHAGRCPDGGMPSRVRLSNGALVTPERDAGQSAGCRARRGGAANRHRPRENGRLGARVRLHGRYGLRMHQRVHPR